MVTPTRIIQKNWSRTFYLLYPPPPPPLPYAPPPLRKRDSRELDFTLTPAMPVAACSYWLNGILHNYDVFLGSKVSLIRAMCDSRKYGKAMMQLNRKIFPRKWGILMLMTDISRCLFVGKILIAQANNWCPSRWTVISFIFVKYAQDSCKYYVLRFLRVIDFH